jgi:hypothetical protein
MTRVQLSVEEYSRGHFDNNIEIQKLLESTWTLPVECGPSSANNVDESYAFDLISRIKNRF